MQRFMKSLARTLARVHRDERGADMVEYILIIAALALPLLGVLIYYREDIRDWVAQQYEDIQAGQGTQ